MNRVEIQSAWKAPVRAWIERTAVGLSAVGDGLDEDFAGPAGEPALVSPDSVSWQVFKNPLSILMGGIAAVVLELAEPRVRSGVYEHSTFRQDPMARLRRTGRATMVTVYGARSRAEAMTARVGRMHARVQGTAAGGQTYRALDPELLRWVHATASYGFLRARDVYVEAVAGPDQDKFYREGLQSAVLYGATGSPSSYSAMEALLAGMEASLEPSPLVFEFLHTMCRLPLLPSAMAPLQTLVVGASLQLLPKSIFARLGLGADWRLRPWQIAIVRGLARHLDRMPIRGAAPVLACRRLGLPADYLYHRA